MSALQIGRVQGRGSSKRHGESSVLAPTALPLRALRPPLLSVPMAGAHRRDCVRHLACYKRPAVATTHVAMDSSKCPKLRFLHTENALSRAKLEGLRRLAKEPTSNE